MTVVEGLREPAVGGRDQTVGIVVAVGGLDHTVFRVAGAVGVQMGRVRRRCCTTGGSVAVVELLASGDIGLGETACSVVGEVVGRGEGVDSVDAYGPTADPREPTQPHVRA